MSAPLTFGLGLPQIAGPESGIADLRSLAPRAEALGFDALWVAEMTRAPALDPLGVLAHAAALTQRVRLGVAVLLTPLRAPIQLARDLATLDVLSGGRLTVGVGLGASPAVYARYGVPPGRRLRRYLDGLALLRALWTQDEVSFENDWWRLEGRTNLVRPVQRPHPPIWIGARRDRAVRRAVELADAWIGSGSAPWSEFFGSLEVALEHLAASGRDPGSFTIGKRVYVAAADDAAQARKRVRDCRDHLRRLLARRDRRPDRRPRRLRRAAQPARGPRRWPPPPASRRRRAAADGDPRRIGGPPGPPVARHPAPRLTGTPSDAGCPAAGPGAAPGRPHAAGRALLPPFKAALIRPRPPA
jgi:alkanesulfonate monooxygenase SsuD/methylene tetrahydromethanopterin reductase-like flavin-dependent oxidoreductase (luciferase family)